MNNLNYPARTLHRLFAFNLLLALMIGPIQGAFAQGEEPEANPAGESGPVTAHVLGTDLFETNPDQLRTLVLGRLLNEYVRENQLEETEEEIFASIALLEHGMKAELGDNFRTLAETPANQRADELRRRTGMASFMVLQWKLNKALFDEFGGRVAMQQLGPLALDGQYTLLMLRQAAGDFELVDEDLTEEFWAYFTDDGQHELLSESEAREIFAVAPWAWALEP